MKIRTDICMTLDVPDGTTIDEDGMILLPGGERVDIEPPVLVVFSSTTHRTVTRDDPEVGVHTYYTTPREVSEDYTGDDVAAPRMAKAGWAHHYGLTCECGNDDCPGCEPGERGLR